MLHRVDSQVVVVGAGPVGLTIAALLARTGRDVVVLESRQQPTPRDESRAITWMPEGLLLADELGITGALKQRASLRTSHEFRRHPQGEAFLTMHLDRLRHRHPYALNLPQHESESLIEEQAIATGRVRILRGRRVNAVRQDDESVMADVTSSEGTTSTVSARFGVAADGAASTRRGVARSLGIASTFADYGARSAVADVELASDPDDGSVSWVALDPRRPTGAFRFGPHRWRLIYRVNDGEQQRAATPDFALELGARIWPSASFERTLWVSTFALGQGQAHAYGAGRWFLVGDAAHAMGPSAGAGMMVGLLGAWRLVQEIGDLTDPRRTLDRYEREQRAVSQQVQRANRMIFRNLALRSVPVGVLRNLAFSIVGRIPGAADRFTAAEALSGLAPRR